MKEAAVASDKKYVPETIFSEPVKCDVNQRERQ